MTIVEEMNAMIEELREKGLKPEHIVMGKEICVRWLVESAQGTDFTFHKVKKYNFLFQKIPVVVCESPILEVLPNPKYLLDGDV